MEWNNGTIFRVFVVSGSPSSTINTEVNIAQMDLNNKVMMGVENYVLRPSVDTAEKQDYWSNASYIQLQSNNLPPFIDYSTFNDPINIPARNTRIFARLPLVATPTLGDSSLTTAAQFSLDRTLNKDTIMYEMINNPTALSSGNLNIRVLDVLGQPVPEDYILGIAFTLVIYKTSNRYN
jgi:hypothetical protein